MGAQVDEREDGLKIPEASGLTARQSIFFRDHRIAIGVRDHGSRADGETMIRGAESAAISYPTFFEALEEVTDC